MNLIGQNEDQVIFWQEMLFSVDDHGGGAAFGKGKLAELMDVRRHHPIAMHARSVLVSFADIFFLINDHGSVSQKSYFLVIFYHILG